MSQQQTVRITTTSTNASSALIINTGYFKTWAGLLKLGEFILGCIAVGIIANHFNTRSLTSELFFYLMSVTFLICTTILLISCLFSWSTGGIISKTIYELIYHSVAAILILVASICLIVALNDSNYNYYNKSVYNQLMTAAVIGVVNGILYLVSAYLAQKSYKGI